MPQNSDSSTNVHIPEVQDILGTPPNWLLRSGMSLFCLSFLVLLATTWFIKYPDTISTTGTLTADAPPVPLVAKSSGKITFFPLHEGQAVEPGELLAVLESSSDFRDVAYIKELIEKSDDVLQKEEFKSNLNLGDLQASYNAWLKSVIDYEFFIRNDFHDRKIAYYLNQIEQKKQLTSYLKEQVKLVERDLSLSQKAYDVENSLFEEKIIASLDLNKSESALLNKKNTYLQAQTSEINTAIQIDELKKLVMDLQIEKEEREKELSTNLKQSRSRLKSEIIAWEQRYTLSSPIKGIVTLHKFRTQNQNVKIGDEVLTIVPEENSKVFYQANLPISGSGKVKSGQEVHIGFEGFPANEYGYVLGKVERLSLTPFEDSYIVKVNLTNDLVTNYGKQLPFKQEMAGTAEIITEDLRLLERFFNNIRGLKR